MTSIYFGLSPVSQMGKIATIHSERISTALVLFFLMVFLVLVGLRLNKVAEVAHKPPLDFVAKVVDTPVTQEPESIAKLLEPLQSTPLVSEVVQTVHKSTIQKPVIYHKPPAKKMVSRPPQPRSDLGSEVTTFSIVQVKNLRGSFCLTHSVEEICHGS